MKRLALVAVLGLTLTACGGQSSKDLVIRLKYAHAYLKVTGPPAAIPSIARSLSVDPLPGGSETAAAVHGRQICSRTVSLATYPETEPKLRGLDGRDVSIAVFGDSRRAALPCQLSVLKLSDRGVAPLLGKGLTPFRNTKDFMEPTLHCPYGWTDRCLTHHTDFLVLRPSRSQAVPRGEIVLFAQTQRELEEAEGDCGEGGPATRRVVGLPGETVREDARGHIWIRAANASTWTKLDDGYIPAKDRAGAPWYRGKAWHVPAGAYFVLSDDRSGCDSRTWGSVPAANITASVVYIIRDGKVLKPPGIPS